MRKAIFSLFFISLVSVLTASSVLGAASLEDKYIKTRNDFIRQFKKATPPDDRAALAKLEKQIRTIVGPLKIEGFPGQGKINLLTLEKSDLGFGQVDGLRFDSGQTSNFVTTTNLLKHYLTEHSKLPKDLHDISSAGDFYSLVFHSDAAVTYFVKLPIKPSANGQYSHAFLGVTAQDIGPFIPKEIFVFVSKGDQIRISTAPVAVKLEQIPKCKSEWERFSKKKAEAYEVYLSSQLKNQKAFNDSVRAEEQGFKAYCQCYERESKNQQFFAPLTKQAQSIADRLLKN